VNVSCEVSIHHLLNSDEACKNFNTTAKLNPPLASSNDRVELIKALKEGKIDILTTLHQPSSPVNKEVAFYDAAYGCEGLKNAMSLYYTKLVKGGILSMNELIKLCVKNPSNSIKAECGAIKEGHRANAMLFDPHKTVVMDERLSLYDKEVLYGEIKRIFY
jgi:dihydroorotase